MQIGLLFVGFALLLLLMYGAQMFARRQKELYQPHLGTVLRVTPTGTREGSLVQTEVEVEIAGTKPRRETIRQWMDAVRLPRPGQVVRVVKQDGTLVLVGFAESLVPEPSQQRSSQPASEPVPPQDVPVSATPDRPNAVLAAAELTPELQNRGKLAIATVLEKHRVEGERIRFALEMDAIGKRPRAVTLEQVLPLDTFAVGERAYLLVDAQDGDRMLLLAPSQIGGQRLPREMNRLDPYVLGPALLRYGARARGTVLSATPMPLSPEHELRGFTRFRLTVRIEPEANLPSYEAEQTITLTRPEKIVAMATPGAVVPLRFDIANPETFTPDSIALGYGDPYAEALQLFREHLTGAATL